MRAAWLLLALSACGSPFSIEQDRARHHDPAEEPDASESDGGSAQPLPPSDSGASSDRQTGPEDDAGHPEDSAGGVPNCAEGAPVTWTSCEQSELGTTAWVCSTHVPPGPGCVEQTAETVDTWFCCPLFDR
jgi:hypothetical protein